MGHKYLGEQLKKLPLDIARKMLENNNSQEIISMCSVNKYYSDLVCNETFWETITKKKYGLGNRMFKKCRMSSWKQVFYYISKPVVNIPEDLLGKVIVKYKDSQNRYNQYHIFSQIIGWSNSWDKFGRSKILFYMDYIPTTTVRKHFRDNEGNFIPRLEKISGSYIRLPLITMDLKNRTRILKLKFDSGRPVFVYQDKHIKKWYRLVEENEYTMIWKGPIPKPTVLTKRGRKNRQKTI